MYGLHAFLLTEIAFYFCSIYIGQMRGLIINYYEYLSL